MIDVKDVQSLKALSPIDLTLLGIVIDTKEEQLWKAPYPIEVQESLIIIVFNEAGTYL